MNNLLSWFREKKTNIICFVISFSISLGAYLANDFFRETLPRKFSESIFWLFAPVFIFSIVNFALKKSIFLSWFKFTKYYLIIALIIIFLTPTSTHGLDFFPIVKETVTIVLASIYSGVSIFLITYKSLKKVSRS
jgi:hypothetical protein